MLHTEIWAPGIVLAADDIRLPVDAPGISMVVEAKILRAALGVAITHANLAAALDDHLAADVLLSVDVDHVAADVAGALSDHAATDVAAAMNHPVAGGIVAVPDNKVYAAVGALSKPGVGDTVIEHADLAPVLHGGGAAGPGHGRTPVGLVHTAFVGADVVHVVGGSNPVLTPTVTVVSRAVIQLSLDTEDGDLLALRYFAEGQLIKIA